MKEKSITPNENKDINTNNNNDKIATSTTINTTTNDTMKTIIEGSIATIIRNNEVFYNPVQVKNRDLSVLMMGLHSERHFKRYQMKQYRRSLFQQARTELKLLKSPDNIKNGNVTIPTLLLKASKKNPNNLIINDDEIDRLTIIYEKDTDWLDLFQIRMTRLRMEKKEEEEVTKKVAKVEESKIAESSSGVVGDPEGIHILDALAASGLRSLRYWKEVQGVQSVTINDLDPAAYDLALINVKDNHCLNDLILDSVDTVDTVDTADITSSNNNNKQNGVGIRIRNGDANMAMYESVPAISPNNIQSSQHHKPAKNNHPRYNIIDLDPYGSASPHLDAAVSSITNNGMICVTSTDMAVLGGANPGKCYARYGSLPVPRAGYLHELAVRALLFAIATAAARHGRIIQPILSVGMDFYVRCFVEIKENGRKADQWYENVGSVLQSVNCPSYVIVPFGEGTTSGTKGSGREEKIRAGRMPINGSGTCAETGGPVRVAGPIWIGPMHDADIVKVAMERLGTVVKDKKKMKKKEEEKEKVTSDEGEKEKDVIKLNEKEEEETKIKESVVLFDGNKTDANNTESIKYPPRYDLLATSQQIRGMLSVISTEIPLATSPLYYNLPNLCRTLGCVCPPLHVIQDALTTLGYKVGGYHKCEQAIKTNASNDVVWDVMRLWCKEHPPKSILNSLDDNNNSNGKVGKGRGEKRKRREERLKLLSKKKKEKWEEEMQMQVQVEESSICEEGEKKNTVVADRAMKKIEKEKETIEEETTGQSKEVVNVVMDINNNKNEDELVKGGGDRRKSAAELILSKPSKIKVNFATIIEQRGRRRRNNVAMGPRFPMNPMPNWGPKAMASGYKGEDDDDDGGDETK